MEFIIKLKSVTIKEWLNFFSGFAILVAPFEIYRYNFFVLVDRIGLPETIGYCPTRIHSCEIRRESFEQLEFYLFYFYLAAAFIILVVSFLNASTSFLAYSASGMAIGWALTLATSQLGTQGVPDYMILFSMALVFVNVMSLMLNSFLHYGFD